MRAYIWTTALLFAVMVVLHLWRLTLEGWRVFADNPVFAISTIVSAVMCAWALRLLKR